MLCARCSEVIQERPINEGSEFFCSLECANRTSGLEFDEQDEYYDEGDLEGMYAEEDE
jgi:hypothetical protein